MYMVTANESFSVQEVSSPLYLIDAHLWNIRALIGYGQPGRALLDALKVQVLAIEEAARAQH